MSESKTSEINPAGMTSLHLAAIRGDETKVQQLLAAGANPNQLNHAGEPPLFNVLRLSITAGPEVIPGREKIFNQLWEATAPEIRMCHDKQGSTVLHLMAANGFDGLTREVLGKEPRLASRPKPYNSREYPIHTAIIHGDLNVAEALFDTDAATSTYMNVKEQLPLHLAAQSSSKEMLELCCAKYTGDIDQVDREGRTALALLRGRANLTESEQADFEMCLISKGAQEDNIDLSRTTQINF